MDPECVAVLKSMKEHWEGLGVFVEHPEIPMDNSEALSSGFQNPQDSGMSLGRCTNSGFAA
jgi:hypothetical protein